MKFLEYQAKAVLRQYGVSTPKLGGVVSKSPQLGKALKTAGKGPWVLKAQILAGGRGKAGGIRLVPTGQEARRALSVLLGKPLITPQTGPEGTKVSKVLVEKALKISREMYLGIVLNRKLEGPVVLACAQGGMEIEELARQRPEQILTEPLHPYAGLASFQVRRLASGLGLPASVSESFSSLLQALIRIYFGLDCSLVEVNPLVLSEEGKLIALDAKLNLDDNALFRHPELCRVAQDSEMTGMERKAKETGISYVSLDGSIGCLVNGAGLAMATMDEIQRQGGMPANFLDVGGGAGVGQVRSAFEILLQDQRVRSVLVNIFGGIMKCDVIAQGILEALKKTRLKLPLIVRLEGTRVEEGRNLLKNSGLPILQADDLAEAARKAVEAAKDVHLS